MNEFQAILQALVSPDRAPCVLSTLVTVAGSSYRRPGARLLLMGDGQKIGSISGGCLEEDVLAHARQVLASGVSKLVTYDTTSENDLVWGVGLGCHGVVKVLLEKIEQIPKWASTTASNLAGQHPTSLAVVWDAAEERSHGTRLASELSSAEQTAAGIFNDVIPAPVRLVIFGAGDDAIPLCRFAKELGWHVVIADPRRELATPARFPLADHIVVNLAAELVQSANCTVGTTAIVMTHHYVHDVPILKALLPLDTGYVGLLGPKKRAERILADLRAAGVHVREERLARFHAPVGLDLGAETPQEVALSIVAEIQAHLTGRDARPLRERTRPIHE